MRMQSLTRHAGVSFNGGPGLVHLRVTNTDPRRLRASWERLVVSGGLGGTLNIDDRGAGETHASAPVYPFLSLTALAAALRADYAGRPIARALADELALAASDARVYEASYGKHLHEAARRGWVVQPLTLGFYPSILLGAGRHARLLAMNLSTRVSSAITLAGTNKAMARDLLAAHGLPVSPGALVGSPDAALRVARRLGGAVVIKRLIGGNSDGVIVDLTDPRDVRSAARTLLAGGHGVIVESLVAGTELRLHYLSGKLHRAYVAEPFTVTGDGARTIGALIAERYPRYLSVMTSAAAYRRRLVMRLWGLGVRRPADIERIIPASKRVVRISAATGADMQKVTATDFIRRSDLAQIERFLAHHGSPSCGIDVIIGTPRAPLSESGVILEINVPCGVMYLDDPARAVAADLSAAIEGDATFRRDKGCVPVWLIVETEARNVMRRAEAALGKRYGCVATGTLDPVHSTWLSLLNQPDADALLIRVSEAAILAHGIPVNLAPVLVHSGDRPTLLRINPATCATVRNAKGRFAEVPE